MEKIGRLQGKQNLRILIQSRSDREEDEALRALWGDHWVKRELALEFTRLGLAVVDEEPDIVLHLFGSPPKRPCPSSSFNLVWVYSHPDEVTPDNLGHFDRIYCASSLFRPKLAAMGYGRVRDMPACTAKQPVRPRVEYDLIFLGNARGSRPDGRGIVRDLGETPYEFKVWGNLWEGIVPEKHYGGRYWAYERLEYLYAAARITLNDHHPDMAREGFVSNKVFDILASGGFVISDRNPGLDSIFGDAAPQYETPEQLRRLVDYFLENSAAREKLRVDGCRAALRHTYRARAQEFVSDLLTPAG
jgi:spore maturation protein CgeB